mgnify:CR=1 FL=1
MKYSVKIEQADGNIETIYSSNNKTEADVYFIRAVSLFDRLDVFLAIEA